MVDCSERLIEEVADDEMPYNCLEKALIIAAQEQSCAYKH